MACYVRNLMGAKCFLFSSPGSLCFTVLQSIRWDQKRRCKFCFWIAYSNNWWWLV